MSNRTYNYLSILGTLSLFFLLLGLSLKFFNQIAAKNMFYISVFILFIIPFTFFYSWINDYITKRKYTLVMYIDAEGNQSYVYKKDAIEDVRNYGGKWRKLTMVEKQKDILKFIEEDTNNYLKALPKKD